MHQLGASPHFVVPYLRSITTGASAAPVFSVQSWNASQCTITAAGGGAVQLAAASNVDIIAQVVSSLVA